MLASLFSSSCHYMHKCRNRGAGFEEGCAFPSKYEDEKEGQVSQEHMQNNECHVNYRINIK
jgi:hypothetical protein